MLCYCFNHKLIAKNVFTYNVILQFVSRSGKTCPRFMNSTRQFCGWFCQYRKSFGVWGPCVGCVLLYYVIYWAPALIDKFNVACNFAHLLLVIPWYTDLLLFWLYPSILSMQGDQLSFLKSHEFLLSSCR